MRRALALIALLPAGAASAAPRVTLGSCIQREIVRTAPAWFDRQAAQSVELDAKRMKVGPGMAREVATRYVRRRFMQVRFCYEQLLDTHPGREGSLRVDFAIAPGGKVGQVRARGLDHDFEACVVGAYDGLEMPKPTRPEPVAVSFAVKLAVGRSAPGPLHQPMPDDERKVRDGNAGGLDLDLLATAGMRCTAKRPVAGLARAATRAALDRCIAARHGDARRLWVTLGPPPRPEEGSGLREWTPELEVEGTDDHALSECVLAAVAELEPTGETCALHLPGTPQPAPAGAIALAAAGSLDPLREALKQSGVEAGVAVMVEGKPLDPEGPSGWRTRWCDRNDAPRLTVGAARLDGALATLRGKLPGRTDLVLVVGPDATPRLLARAVAAARAAGFIDVDLANTP